MELFGSYSIFWFVVGFVMLCLEALTVGVFCVFFGAGAWLVLVLTLLLPPIPPAVQWIVFSISSTVFLLVLRSHLSALFAKRGAGRDDSLKDPLVAERYLGREFQVAEAVGPSLRGLVEVDGTLWRARSSQDLPAGSMVRVVEVNDLTLLVESVDLAASVDS